MCGLWRSTDWYSKSSSIESALIPFYKFQWQIWGMKSQTQCYISSPVVSLIVDHWLCVKALLWTTPGLLRLTVFCAHSLTFPILQCLQDHSVFFLLWGVVGAGEVWWGHSLLSVLDDFQTFNLQLLLALVIFLWNHSLQLWLFNWTQEENSYWFVIVLDEWIWLLGCLVSGNNVWFPIFTATSSSTWVSRLLSLCF